MSYRANVLCVLASACFLCVGGCASETVPAESGDGAAVAPSAVHSSASVADADRAVPVSATSESAQPSKTNALVIGHLKGRDHTLTIYSSADGPRFTVSKEGKVLATEISLDQLRARHRDLFQKYQGAFAGSAGVSGTLDASR